MFRFASRWDFGGDIIRDFAPSVDLVDLTPLAPLTVVLRYAGANTFADIDIGANGSVDGTIEFRNVLLADLTGFLT